MKLLHLFEELTMLGEAKTDRYLQMFSGIFNLLDRIDMIQDEYNQRAAQQPGYTESELDMAPLKVEIQEQVNWAVNVLERADRITWWLRWYKIWVLQELASWDDLERSGVIPPEISQWLQKS